MAAAFPDFNERKQLPIDSHKWNILERIRKNQVTCIHGETGCGKSTRVPEFILEEYHQKILFGEEHIDPPNIVITQPRRIGAKSLAKRVANELGEPDVGGLVGYKIGQDYVCGDLTQICYVTSGYLIELLVHHPRSFEKYSHVILDEVHERDMDADLLSLVIKLLMETQNRPKLIVMSATLQVNLFLKYFVGNLEGFEKRNQVYNVNVSSPFSVDVVYLEQFCGFLLNRDIILSEETRRLILITYCQFLQIKPMDIVLGSDSEEHGMMAELAETLENIPDIKLKSREVQPVDDCLPLAVSLIKATAQKGGSILVFLPGVREIEELFDKLLPFEDSHHTGWNCQLLLFPLHSKVPFDDQLECFQPPESHVCHVIMATNIAESSITLPKISVVLDFGQKRHLTYDTTKRIEFLKLVWCSKASMDQRKGRTGRVCDGVCFRIMPQQFYNQLEDYDHAEMKAAPLDKLVLKVKQVAEKIAPKESVTELLAQAVEPPSVSKIDCALKNLAGIGAITENDENAQVTVLGRLCAYLPLDMYLCRLVMFGVFFNQPCDAVVMAAALQGQDPFKKPTKRIIKNQTKFIGALRGSCDSRRKFDDKCFSEPIMYRNLMKEWLSLVNLKRSEEAREGELNMIKLRRRFCKDSHVDHKALSAIEGLVFEIANSLIRWLPKISQNKIKVEDLVKVVPTKRKLLDFQNVSLTENFMEDLFCANVLQLHMIMAAAFVPRFLFGEVKSRKGYLPNTELKEIMRGSKMDPANSVIVTDLPIEVQEAEDRAIHHMIEDLCLTLDNVIAKYPNVNFQFKRLDSQLLVEFDKSGQEDNISEMLEVTGDVHVGVHYMYQYSEAPSVKKNQFAYQMKGPGDKQKRIQLKMPQNPFKTEWILLSYDGSPLNSVGLFQETECRIFCDWRNPVGFVFDTANRPHYGLTADVRAGGSGSGDVKNDYSDVLWKSGFCWAEGATLLPTYQQNRFALLLMLAFIPDLDQVVFTVNTTSMTIVKLHLYDFSMEVPQAYPLTKKLMRTINKMRTEVSRVFSEGLRQPENALLNCRLETLFKRLMLELSEDDATMSATSSGLKQDSKHATKDLPKRIDIPASYRSLQVPEEFVYLHPYDTNVLFKREALEKCCREMERTEMYSSDSSDSDDIMEAIARSLIDM